MQNVSPELNVIESEITKLKKSSFSLDSKFLDSFFDPIPKGIGKYVFLLFIVVTVTNILALFVILIYYIFGPRKTRHARPRKDTAEEWFKYAEKCQKYSFRNEIIDGYIRALELEPDNGQILLRYNQYLVSELVHNKTPATGQPVGMKVNKQEGNSYETFTNLVDEWMTSHKGELFPNPLKPKQKEKVFTLATWASFDNKKYDKCLKYGEYCLAINELDQTKKGREEKIELLLLLSCSEVLQNDIEKGIEYLLQALTLASNSSKTTQAMVWELTGEYFYENKKESSAEYCFVLAQKKDMRRWISAYRLFRWYSKQNDYKKSSLYKNRYIRMQKELSPL